MKKTSFRLPEALYSEFLARCRSSGVSASAAVQALMSMRITPALEAAAKKRDDEMRKRDQRAEARQRALALTADERRAQRERIAWLYMKGKSYKEIGADVGLSPSAISLIVRGKR